jgi:transposase-like protein
MAATTVNRLTARVTGEIVAAVKSTGAKPYRAAQRAGVHKSTFYLWSRTAEGARAKKPNARSQYERRCLELMNEIEAAHASYTSSVEALLTQFLTGALQIPLRAGGHRELTIDDPALILRAVQYVLEHKLPDEYGSRSRLDLTGGDDAAGQPLPLRVDVEDVWQKLDKIRRRRAGETVED